MSVISKLDVEIGECVRHARLSKGLTQTMLARRLNVELSEISRIETGQQRIRSSQLWAICHRLNVPVSVFLDSLKYIPELSERDEERDPGVPPHIHSEIIVSLD
jgi:transcriptional regulator with XRE-family HTH domain